MKIWRATLVALAIAVVVLFVAVLPAEYGIDPLGTGRALGLTALAGVKDEAAPEPAAPPTQKASLEQDTYTVELRPFEVGSSRVDLQACKLEYSIVSPK